jgi:hypothetical protein
MPARPSKELKLDRESKAWELRCAGLTHRRIAARLGVTRRAVGLILDRVEKRVLAELSTNVEQTKATQHGQLDYVIQESLGAWRKSKKPRSRAVEKTDDEGKVTQSEAIDQNGDPRHLATAMSAMDRQRNLWGLDVLAATQETAASVSQVMAGLAERKRAYEERKAANPAGDPAGAGGAAGGGA